MNRNFFAAVFVFIFCTNVSPVLCADMSVFGLSLGQDITLPECPKGVMGYGIVRQVCFARMDEKEMGTGPVANGNVYIKFPLVESPSIVSGDSLIGLIIDGNLEGVGFNTMGIRNADSVLETLKGKYGNPTTFSPRKVQNMAGGTFNAFVATWSVGDIKVMFNSVSSELDSGLVNIDTKKGYEYRREAIERITKDKHPL